ncbi:toll/interleukin-1 receptor domain-containing protein [Promicromonospora sp. NPDC050880]|uniref:toll/interleukin-1 receptor domain-containing protein n=1 Tax=Promicromonospora sp. NPDC050880 TaxID=3364406 RepID=UPI00378CA02D
MTTIFVSYRHDDTRQESVRYHEYLRSLNHVVFLDDEAIPPGADFPPVLWESIRRSDVVLALIGPRWAAGGRITAPDDYVRREVELALDLGKKVIPVLVDGAAVPRAEDLPPSLARLAHLNAETASGPGLAWLGAAIEEATSDGAWDGPSVHLANRVRALLGAAGLATSAIRSAGVAGPWFVASGSPGSGGWHRPGDDTGGAVLVACTTSEPRVADLTGLPAAAEAAGAGRAVLVVDDRTDPDALRSLPPVPGTRVLTLHDLVRTLAPLDPYVTWLRETYGASIARVADSFVDLSAAKSERQADGAEIARSARSSLSTTVDKWRRDRSGTQLALLGDFGSGKSWFCLELAHEQLGRLDADRVLAEARLPVLVPLREVPPPKQDAAGRSDWSALGFFESFCARHGIPRPVAAVLEELNDQGLLLLLCDGFDEMPRAADETVKEAFDRLRTLAGRESKMVVTSRINSFRDVDEEAGAILGDPARRFDILYLRDFSRSQILDLVKARHPADWPSRWTVIEGTYGLLDLVRRPFVLNMVLEILPALRGRGRTRATLAALYEEYTRRWIEEIGGGRPRAVGPADRKRLMQRLAWNMFVRDTLEVLPEDVTALVAAENLVRLPGFQEAVEADLTTQTYLLRDAQGRYRFAHKSFLEYFVADHVVTELAESRFDVLATRTLSPEIVAFLADMDLDPQRLYDHLDHVRAHGDDGYTAGNVLSLLHVQGFSLRRGDFSGLVIKGADVSGDNLERATFAGSVLESLNVTDARLVRADFTGARFADLILGVRSPGKGVATGPDGARAVTVGDNTVALLDADGAVRTRLRGPADSLTSVEISPDGHLVAAGSFDRTVAVWHLAGTDGGPRSRRPGDVPAHVLTGHTATVYDVAFDPRGGYVFTAGSDHQVKAWSLADGAERWSSRAHARTVYSIGASPDGRRLATGSFDDTVGLWELRRDPIDGPQLTGVELLGGHEALVNGVAWHPASHMVASASNDGTVRLWDVAARAARETLAGHETIVWSVAFSPDGRLLASGDSDGVVRLWEVPSDGRPTLLRVLEAHTAAVWNLAFSHSGDALVSGSFDRTVKVWDTRDWAERSSLDLAADRNQRIDCRWMRITGAQGLSPLQEQFLMAQGARR